MPLELRRLSCPALGRWEEVGDGDEAARYSADKQVWLGCQFGGDAELVMGGASRFMQA